MAQTAGLKTAELIIVVMANQAILCKDFPPVNLLFCQVFLQDWASRSKGFSTMTQVQQVYLEELAKKKWTGSQISANYQNMIVVVKHEKSVIFSCSHERIHSPRLQSSSKLCKFAEACQCMSK
jgi:hypothetical protein